MFLAQSISSIVQKGFIVYSLATLLFLFSLLSSKYSAGKIIKLLVILVVAASTTSSVLDHSNYLKFCGKYVSDYIGKAWKVGSMLLLFL